MEWIVYCRWAVKFNWIFNSKSTVDGQFKFMEANAMLTTVGLSTAVGQFAGRQQLGCLLQLGSTLGDNSWVLKCNWAFNLLLK